MAVEYVRDESYEEADAPEEASYGREILSWAVDEYERRERGPVWYAVAGIIGVAMLAYAVLTQNFLFAMILIMFAVLIGLSGLREPRKLVFVITDLGVAVGEKFYPFKEFKEFWMIYEPPHVKNMYLEFKSAPRPHLIVPLHDQDPMEVRDSLLRFMKENTRRDDEPFSDTLARLLKL